MVLCKQGLLQKFTLYPINDILKHHWGSKGFDRDDEGGEAIRKQYVTRKPKINANDNRQLAAA